MDWLHTLVAWIWAQIVRAVRIHGRVNVRIELDCEVGNSDRDATRDTELIPAVDGEVIPNIEGETDKLGELGE
jgi:hypothetical protein